jgi:hypothetical protein
MDRTLSTEWTGTELEAQGYFLDGDDGKTPNETDRKVNSNAAHRESLLPSSRATGPLAEKEAAAPLSEVERLFPDRERVARKLARIAED